MKCEIDPQYRDNFDLDGVILTLRALCAKHADRMIDARDHREYVRAMIACWNAHRLLCLHWAERCRRGEECYAPVTVRETFVAERGRFSTRGTLLPRAS